MVLLVLCKKGAIMKDKKDKPDFDPEKGFHIPHMGGCYPIFGFGYQSAASLAELVRKRRYELQLTQRELSERTIISSGYIGRIEAGHSTPRNPEVLSSLAKALELDYRLVLDIVTIETATASKLSKKYSRTFNLIAKIVALMTEEQAIQTIVMFEHKLGLFNEPELTLAKNFIRLLTGELALEEDPGNGTHPLKHYFTPFSDPTPFRWSPSYRQGGID